MLNWLTSLGRYFLSMFEEKQDGLRRLSMTRVLAAFIALTFVSTWRAPLGWPDAFVVFTVLFSVGISKALRAAPAEAVVKAVTGMFGKGTPTQIIGGTALAFVPEQWNHEDMEDEGVL